MRSALRRTNNKLRILSHVSRSEEKGRLIKCVKRYEGAKKLDLIDSCRLLISARAEFIFGSSRNKPL